MVIVIYQKIPVINLAIALLWCFMCVCVFPPPLPSQGLYAIARTAGAVMYESAPRCQFLMSNGDIVTEKLFGFPIISDDTIVTQDVVAIGYDCGAPPEPAVMIPYPEPIDHYVHAYRKYGILPWKLGL